MDRLRFILQRKGAFFHLLSGRKLHFFLSGCATAPARFYAGKVGKSEENQRFFTDYMDVLKLNVDYISVKLGWTHLLSHFTSYYNLVGTSTGLGLAHFFRKPFTNMEFSAITRV